MKIHDISQEVFSCAVFPGDIPPERKVLETIKEKNLLWNTDKRNDIINFSEYFYDLWFIRLDYILRNSMEGTK